MNRESSTATTATTIIAAIGTLVMLSALIWGFTGGSFWAEGKILIGLPWGVISIIDVYTGIMLFSVWVIYRENSIIIPLAWILFFIVWGNFGTSLYLFIAALRSGGNIKQLLLGARHYERD